MPINSQGFQVQTESIMNSTPPIPQNYNSIIGWNPPDFSRLKNESTVKNHNQDQNHHESNNTGLLKTPTMQLKSQFIDQLHYKPPSYMNSMLAQPQNFGVPQNYNRVSTPCDVNAPPFSSIQWPVNQNRSPEFEPILADPNNPNTLCPLIGCGKKFKGVKGVKAHARYQHHDHKLVIKNGIEGFVRS